MPAPIVPAPATPSRFIDVSEFMAKPSIEFSSGAGGLPVARVSVPAGVQRIRHRAPAGTETRATGNPPRHRQSPAPPAIPRATGNPPRHRQSPAPPAIPRATGIPRPTGNPPPPRWRVQAILRSGGTTRMAISREDVEHVAY